MRLIDADALMRELMRTINTLQMMDDTESADKVMRGVHIVGNSIRSAPTINAVEVVRCRDCKHRYGDECPMRHVEWVTYEDDGFIERDDIVHDNTQDDGYCNFGEREDGEA